MIHHIHSSQSPLGRAFQTEKWKNTIHCLYSQTERLQHYHYSLLQSLKYRYADALAAFESTVASVLPPLTPLEFKDMPAREAVGMLTDSSSLESSELSSSSSSSFSAPDPPSLFPPFASLAELPPPLVVYPGPRTRFSSILRWI